MTWLDRFMAWLSPPRRCEICGGRADEGDHSGCDWLRPGSRWVELPQLDPGVEESHSWSETVTPSTPPSASRYDQLLYRGTPAPKVPRPGED